MPFAFMAGPFAMIGNEVAFLTYRFAIDAPASGQQRGWASAYDARIAMPRPSPHDVALKELHAFGLAYPETHTKSPWPGHMDLPVKDKTFAYLSIEGDPLSISCKLPHSGAMALMLPFTKPTPYGLGKSGWVSAEFAPGQTPPVAMLKQWIDESYRAQAPKKLVAKLDGPDGAEAPKRAPAKRATARRTVARKRSRPRRP